MTHLRALGTPHGNKIGVRVNLPPEDFERVSRLAYARNVPVAALMRQMIMRQLEAVG